MNHLFVFLFISCFFPIDNVILVNGSSLRSTKAQNYCQWLKLNYSFEYSFNQIVATSYRSEQNDYYHYLMASNNRFLRFHFDRNDQIQVQPIEFSDQQQVLDSNSPSGDFGFSLHLYEPFKTKLCQGKIKSKLLTCIDIEHNVSKSDSYPGKMQKKENYSFKLSDDFRPSVAFSHIGYDQYPNSRFMIVFVEQKVKQIDSKKQYSINKEKSTTSLIFERRWQTYSFQRLDNIVNLTYSAVVPNYLKFIPDSLELTGIFGWIRKNNNEEEVMILTFNGTDHLYCLNLECANIKKYKPFMSECRLNQLLTNLDHRFFVTRCCGQWEINGSKDDDQWKFHDGKLVRVKTYRFPFGIVLSCLLGMIIIILLLSILWIYTCINESRYEEKMIKNKKINQELLEKQQLNHNQKSTENFDNNQLELDSPSLESRRNKEISHINENDENSLSESQ